MIIYASDQRLYSKASQDVRQDFVTIVSTISRRKAGKSPVVYLSVTLVLRRLTKPCGERNDLLFIHSACCKGTKNDNSSLSMQHVVQGLSSLIQIQHSHALQNAHREQLWYFDIRHRISSLIDISYIFMWEQNQISNLAVSICQRSTIKRDNSYSCSLVVRLCCVPWRLLDGIQKIYLIYLTASHGWQFYF